MTTEQTRAQTITELTPPGGGASTVFPDEEPAGYVRVGTGLYTEPLPVAGMTVAHIRDTFSDRLDIDPGAQAVIDGRRVTDESTRVGPGQQLAFVRHAGEKGLGDDRSGPPDESGGSYESECRPEGPYGALKQKG